MTPEMEVRDEIQIHPSVHQDPQQFDDNQAPPKRF